MPRKFNPAADRLLLALGLGVGALVMAGGADGTGAVPGLDLDAVGAGARRASAWFAAWYARTAPADRVTWGGLAAAAGLGLGVVLERLARLRPRRVVPPEFDARFLERLREGKLDRGKALDYCELHPSPASRVALAAVRRWGRPSGDLERAVGLAHRVEADRLRRHVGTLRRLAALAPLIGLLGSLVAAGRVLSGLGAAPAPGAWGPALASCLGPLTAGVGLAILSLVGYDGLAGRVEWLAGALERVGAESIDAIAMALPPEPRPAAPLSVTPGRTPHQLRIDLPSTPGRKADRVADLDDDDY